MENEKYLLVFQYPRLTEYSDFRYTWEYWGTTEHANGKGFKQNHSDHLILNVKDYKWEKN